MERIDHMKYLPGMEVIDSDIMDTVLSKMSAYDPAAYTDADVSRALANDTRSAEDFGALLSPAAFPRLEEMARAAQSERAKHFGSCVYIFTPLYIANYCDNFCVYCGFNKYNGIRRAKLSSNEIEREMEAISGTGQEEILLLTGESRAMSDVEYIGDACELAKKYFKNVGLEIYPVNSDEYAYLHGRGADFVTVFQETYNSDRYEKLHLEGNNNPPA